MVVSYQINRSVSSNADFAMEMGNAESSEKKTSIKVIFLVVYGVLNCVSSVKNKDEDIHILDADMLDKLQKIALSTHAKVFLTFKLCITLKI